MSAGTGVRHSEYNHSASEEGHFLQIWIVPQQKGVTPRYGQKSFKEAFHRKNFNLVVSGDGREESILIHQDADVYIGRLNNSERIDFNVRLGRHAWIQMVKGQMQVNDVQLQTGDGLAVSEESSLHLSALSASEFLLFDLT